MVMTVADMAKQLKEHNQRTLLLLKVRDYNYIQKVFSRPTAVRRLGVQNRESHKIIISQAAARDAQGLGACRDSWMAEPCR
jgi:hypothetical protein